MSTNPSAKVITELSVGQLQDLQTNLKNNILIIKFGANWCGPCKKIAPIYHEFINKCPANIICADINIDDNMNLYMALKKHKMVQGIPVFLAFFGEIKRDVWFIPNDSIIGADEKQVINFFNRCLIKANDLAINSVGYTYFS